jgi:hypothetical protein
VTANRIGVAMKGAGSGKAQGDVIASLSACRFRGDTGRVGVDCGSVSSGVCEGSLLVEGAPGWWKRRRSRASVKAVLGGLWVSHPGSEGFPNGPRRGGDRGTRGRPPVMPWVQ